MTITLEGDYLYYFLSIGAIVYLFWESWLCLIEKKTHITIWARLQLWFLKKSYGVDAMKQKEAELTTGKHLHSMGIEALIAGTLLLIALLVQLTISN